MTIYAELLFLENLITGIVILLLTKKISGRPASGGRVTAGAIMCGLYAFVLFIQMHWLAALVSKMLFSVAVVLVVFGINTWRNVAKNAIVFYIVSFMMGGITIALMYMLEIPGMTENGSFVLKGASFLQIIAGVAATWYLGNRLAELLREKVIRQNMIHQVTIRIADNEWKMKALIDTGNSLRDPVTGYPVAVLSKKFTEIISRDCNCEQFSKVAVIPYRTVGKSSVMFGLRPDRVVIDGREIHNIVLGFGERNFSPWQNTEKYDLLLHQQFLEGEENDD